MQKLGKHLKQLREEHGFSKRHVESLSKQLYPKDKRRQLSNVYLIKLEEGAYQAPSPFKLKSLAQIYKVDYQSLMQLAQYVEEEDDEDELFLKVKSHLNDNGVNGDYFLKGILDLSEESLAILNRTLSLMAIQEKQIKAKEKNEEQVQK